jgi:hypothetical protein
VSNLADRSRILRALAPSQDGLWTMWSPEPAFDSI